jgi:hypothetical protein
VTGAARRVATALAAWAALALAAACGGGGSGTGGDPVVPGDTCIDFVPAAAGPVAGTVVLQKDAAASSCNLVAVDLVARNVSDVHAAAFRVRYRPAGSTLVSYLAHELRDETFLDADGTAVLVQQVETAPGVLDVGITRQPANACAGPNGVSVGASPRVVARLLFTRTGFSGTGTSAVTFESPGPELLDSQCPPQTISTSAWQAGTLVVD